MISKRSAIAIVSIVLFAIGVKLVIACADVGDPADMYVSFFQNNITAQPQYKPFYYTEFSTLYGEWPYGPVPEDDVYHDGNTEEWCNYSKKAAKSTDIDSFMNKYTYKQVKALSDKSTAVPQDMKNNSFSKFLLEENNKDALDYLLYAKKCEPVNAAVEGLWDNASKTNKIVAKDTAPRRKLIAEGVSMNTKSKNEFLKWRYAYQVLRLALYCRDYKTTLSLYEKMMGKKTSGDLIYARCVALKAGALYHTGKKKMAAYLYSKAFDLSDDMKRSAMLSFNWSTDSMHVADVLPLCKNAHEKAVLLVMDGLYERNNEMFEGMKLLQKAYALDPNVKGLDIIMTREINKAEHRYMQEREIMERGFTNTFEANYTFDAEYARKRKDEWKSLKGQYKKYLADLNSFSQKAAKDTKTKDKAFWLLSSSYIYFMQDKFADSKKQLDLAGKEKMNTHEHDVHDIINMLCIVHKDPQLTPQSEAELLPCLKWVEKRETKSVRFHKVYRDMLATVLTDKYMQQKDTVRALFCQARVDKDEKGELVVADDYTDIPGTLIEHMSIDKLHEVQAFILKNDKSTFEKWLTDNTPYQAVVLKEIEGTKYIREMQFDKAVAVLSTLSRGMLSTTVLPDVLVDHIQDSQEWNKKDSAKTYNKLEFAQKMLSLEKTLEKQPGNGRVAYQYANALYNMSYYGRAHHAVDYYRSTYDEKAYYTTLRKDLPDNKKEYYGLVKAQKYYNTAFNNMSDPEMKARCLFMSAKCWQKNCNTGGKDNSADDKTYYRYSLTSPYFQRLYNEYRNTKLYREAFSSCSYLRDYAHKQ